MIYQKGNFKKTSEIVQMKFLTDANGLKQKVISRAIAFPHLCAILS